MDFLNLVLGLMIIILGFWVWKLYQNKKQGEGEARALEKEKDELEQMLQSISAKAPASQSGLADYQQKLQKKKEQAKAKIMQMLKEKGKISNSEVAKALNISSATVRRYFDELEAENKAKQVGQDGRSVVYTAI